MRQTTRTQPRNILLGIALVGAIVALLAVVEPHYSAMRWLCWRYLGYWGMTLTWAASCAAFGMRLLRRMAIHERAASDGIALGFPLGVFCFAMAVFVLGLVHLLNVFVFVALPALFLFLGADDLYKACQSRFRAAKDISHVDLLVVLFGVAGIGLLYFQILTPETLGHDARWYHLPLGQRYAYTGAIGPAPEGWWLAAYPHLASFLYAWAFLLPGVTLFDHYALCSHVEFAIFLATLGAVPSLVRALVPGIRATHSWVVFFLFPGIFLYDANLNGAADHIAALWAVPIAITTIRLWTALDLKICMLWAVFVSAAALTKYMAFSLIAFPALLLVVRTVWLTVRRIVAKATGRSQPVAALGLTVSLGLVLTSAHWLKNWLWYGDPLYPTFHEWLKVHPWNSDSVAMFDLFVSFLTRTPMNWQGVSQGLEAVATFSYRAIDWYAFHHHVPVFGFLFASTALCLPFVKSPLRLWLAYLAACVGVFTWYMVCHQERYLQIILPWMVGCVAATLSLIWQTRLYVIRGLATVLVGLQILWGSDIPFLPTNNLLGDTSFRVVTRFLASGFMKTPRRLRPFGDTGAGGARVPRDATVLLHNVYPYGYDANFIQDLWQGRLNYGELASPRAIYKELRTLGVTHVVWITATGLEWTSLAHDLAFANFAANYVTDPIQEAKVTVGALTETEPSEPFNDLVAAFTCGAPKPSGWYRFSALRAPRPGELPIGPESPLNDVGEAIAKAGFVLVTNGCVAQLPASIDSLFHPPFIRGNLKMYVRRLGR